MNKQEKMMIVFMTTSVSYIMRNILLVFFILLFPFSSLANKPCLSERQAVNNAEDAVKAIEPELNDKNDQREKAKYSYTSYFTGIKANADSFIGQLRKEDFFVHRDKNTINMFNKSIQDRLILAKRALPNWEIANQKWLDASDRVKSAEKELAARIKEYNLCMQRGK